MKFINFKNIIILSIIILLSLYHFYIHNGLEKLLSQSYFNYDSVKRPLSNCSNQSLFELSKLSA